MGPPAAVRGHPVGPLAGRGVGARRQGDRPGKAADSRLQVDGAGGGVGLVVDDLDAAKAVVKAAGLEPFNHADYEPGRRFYFFDWDGIEFEIVSYN